MAKLLITRAGEAPVHRFIDSERISMGRQPGCDLILDGNGVSKEHAVLLTIGNDHILEDQGSTNGTLVNGQPIRRRILQNRDQIDIGPYRIQYVNQRAMSNMDFDQTMLFEGESVGDSQDETPVVETARQRQISGPVGNLRGVKGSAEGKEIDLGRLIKNVGRAETQQAAILRRPKGYVVMQVSGKGAVRVNGDAIGEEWRNLAVGDKLEVDGGQYVFELVPDAPASWPKDGL